MNDFEVNAYICRMANTRIPIISIVLNLDGVTQQRGLPDHTYFGQSPYAPVSRTPCAFRAGVCPA